VAAEVAPFEGVLAKKGEKIQKTLSLVPSVKAPVHKGQVLGKLTLEQGGRVIAEIDIVAACDVERLSYGGILSRLLRFGLMRG
jgi:D-alanyl-D-alanine carboxypeptidase (penicillin-binding protein 5/6)